MKILKQALLTICVAMIFKNIFISLYIEELCRTSLQSIAHSKIYIDINFTWLQSYYSGCPRDTDAWNIEWPSTRVGDTSQLCPGSQGIL